MGGGTVAFVDLGTGLWVWDNRALVGLWVMFFFFFVLCVEVRSDRVDELRRELLRPARMGDNETAPLSAQDDPDVGERFGAVRHPACGDRHPTSDVADAARTLSTGWSEQCTRWKPCQAVCSQFLLRRIPVGGVTHVSQLGKALTTFWWRASLVDAFFCLEKNVTPADQSFHELRCLSRVLLLLAINSSLGRRQPRRSFRDASRASATPT